MNIPSSMPGCAANGYSFDPHLTGIRGAAPRRSSSSLFPFRFKVIAYPIQQGSVSLKVGALDELI